MPGDPTGPVEAELCTRCGLCCDGTLFSRVELDPDEIGDERTAKLGLVDVEGKVHFDQPCGHFRDGLCSIYACRFHRCQQYRCGLLERQEAGSLSLDECHAHVDFALKLRAEVATSDPQATTYDARQSLRTELETELREKNPEDRHGIARRLLNLAALDHYLSTWFRKRSDGEPGR